jgi:hypothetical protein
MVGRARCQRPGAILVQFHYLVIPRLVTTTQRLTTCNVKLLNSYNKLQDEVLKQCGGHISDLLLHAKYYRGVPEVRSWSNYKFKENCVWQ